MCKLPLRPFLFAAACAAAGALMLYFAPSVLWSAQAQTIAPAEEQAWSDKEFAYYGADSCKQCHSTPGAFKPEFVKLTEYTTWKTVDKHSMAYAVLEGQLGRTMSKRLKDGDETFVLKPEAGCLGCHSMHYPGREGELFSLKDGVSCDGCHGPSKKWLTDHWANKENWRRKTPEEKYAFGMRDLRNPSVRAKLCSSCHIGSAEEGKVVTHAMYAVGHPLLASFEVASFSRNLPQHWYDLKDVPLFKEKRDLFKDRYDLANAAFQNTKVALAGGVSSLRQQMALVAGRAELSQKWPELALPVLAKEKETPKSLWDQAVLAHSDCAACHHELRIPSWRAERGYGLFLPSGEFLRSKPGRVQPRLWSLPLATMTLPANETKELTAALKKLHATCDATPFGEIDEVGKAAAAARDAVHPKLAAALNVNRADAVARLKQLTELGPNMVPDFDTARQLAAAFTIIYSEVEPKPASDAQVRDLIAALERHLDLGPSTSLEERRKLAITLIEMVSNRKIDTEEALQQAVLNAPSDKLREALLNREHIDAVQKLRDRELAATLRNMGQYDPGMFKKQMMELHKLIGGPAPK